MRRSPAILHSVGVALVALVLAVQPVSAVTWTPKVDISGTNKTVDGGAIAVSAGRVFVAYVEEQRAWVRSSTDRGATFGPPVQVSDGAAVAYAPSVAAGSGRGYVAWTETPAGGLPRVWFRRSIDGGATWSPAVALTPAGTSAVSRAQVFAVSARVFLAYVDTVAHRVYLKRSTTSGETFATRVALGSSWTGGDVTMAFGTDVTYVAWESIVGGVRLRRSINGGATWGAARTLQQDTSSHPEDAEPSLAARGSHAVIAMARRSGIAVRVTTDRGVTWSGAVIAAPQTSVVPPIGPPVAIRGASGWWLMYASCPSGSCEAMHIRVRTSRDGRSWSGSTLVSKGGLVFAQGGAYSAVDGRVWLAWWQEPSWELDERFVVRVRSGT